VTIEYTQADGVARIVMTDGDRGNSINGRSAADLFAAVRRANAEGARVIVLSATGRFFCVGGDLVAFAGAPSMPDFIDDLADGLHRLISELQRSPAVVVSVVQGAAAGAGFPLAAAADIVVAAESAKFSLGYTKVGLSIDGGSSLLVHSLGQHTMLRLALLNDTLTAAELRDVGLVARVAPDEQLAAVAQEVVDTLAALPAKAQATAKRLVRDTADLAPERALRNETLGIRANAATHDGREGVTSFLEKRKPAFTHE